MDQRPRTEGERVLSGKTINAVARGALFATLKLILPARRSLKGRIAHHALPEHSSIASFCKASFSLPSMTARDGSSSLDDPMSPSDFTQAPRPCSDFVQEPFGFGSLRWTALGKGYKVDTSPRIPRRQLP